MTNLKISPSLKYESKVSRNIHILFLGYDQLKESINLHVGVTIAWVFQLNYLIKNLKNLINFCWTYGSRTNIQISHFNLLLGISFYSLTVCQSLFKTCTLMSFWRKDLQCNKTIFASSLHIKRIIKITSNLLRNAWNKQFLIMNNLKRIVVIRL